MCFVPRIDDVFEKRIQKRLDRISERCELFEQKIAAHPNDYGVWLKYLSFIGTQVAPDNHELVRSAYTIAVTHLPLNNNNATWLSYIDVWLSFALYEENSAKDIGRARQVFQTFLDTIPQTTFTSSEISLWYARFEQRNRNIPAARAILEQAIDKFPNGMIYNCYIDMESKLGEIERCRILYKRFLAFKPQNSFTWIDYAEMEASLGGIYRANKIFEEGLSQNDLDDPDMLQDAYDEFLEENQIYLKQLSDVLSNKTPTQS